MSHDICLVKPMQNALVESSCIEDPADARAPALWITVGCVHIYGLLVRPKPWPLILMEIANGGPFQRAPLLRLKLLRGFIDPQLGRCPSCCDLPDTSQDTHQLKPTDLLGRYCPDDPCQLVDNDDGGDHGPTSLSRASLQSPPIREPAFGYRTILHAPTISKCLR